MESSKSPSKVAWIYRIQLRESSCWLYCFPCSTASLFFSTVKFRTFRTHLQWATPSVAAATPHYSVVCGSRVAVVAGHWITGSLDQSRRHAGTAEPVDSLRLVLLLQQRLHLPLLLFFLATQKHTAWFRIMMLVSYHDPSSNKDLNSFNNNSCNMLPVIWVNIPSCAVYVIFRLWLCPAINSNVPEASRRQTAALGCFHPAPPLQRTQTLRFLQLIQDLPITAKDVKEGNNKPSLNVNQAICFGFLWRAAATQRVVHASRGVQVVKSHLVVIHPAQVGKLPFSQGRLSGYDEPPATKSPTLCGRKHLLSSAPLLLSVLLRWPWTRATERLWKTKLVRSSTIPHHVFIIYHFRHRCLISEFGRMKNVWWINDERRWKHSRSCSCFYLCQSAGCWSKMNKLLKLCWIKFRMPQIKKAPQPLRLAILSFWRFLLELQILRHWGFQPSAFQINATDLQLFSGNAPHNLLKKKSCHSNLSDEWRTLHQCNTTQWQLATLSALEFQPSSPKPNSNAWLPVQLSYTASTLFFHPFIHAYNQTEKQPELKLLKRQHEV